MNVLESIGNTPIVSLERLNPNPRVKVFAKLEGANPGGSVKDRIAELKDGTIVVILPDRGEKYLSTSLFASVCAECPPSPDYHGKIAAM